MVRTPRSLIGLLTTCAVLVHGAALVRADDDGSRGTLVALSTNTQSADLFLQYHGQMFVKNADGVLDEYRWGGTSCGSRTLTEAELAMLQRALERKNMTIEPRSQTGQGDTRCLVGFTLVEKKNLKLFP